MNERYLFRAKRIDNGEWVEGGSIITFLDGGVKSYYMPAYAEKCTCIHDENDNITSFENCIFYRVDPSTICQCTGLKDKNGKLIWENDICIIRDGTLDEEDGYFRLDWECERVMFEFEGTGLCVNFDNVYGYECEVVGNIFDNPELMEQEG